MTTTDALASALRTAQDELRATFERLERATGRAVIGVRIEHMDLTLLNDSRPMVRPVVLIELAPPVGGWGE